MAYIFRTRRKDGTLHPKWRYRIVDWQGFRKTFTGTTNRRETERLAAVAEADQEAIRKGWRTPPKKAEKPRSVAAVISEYLEWGTAQGGRGGRPWAKDHVRKRRSHLRWWVERLGLRLISDLHQSLARVEKVLREERKAGSAGKTVRNKVEALGAFCRWAKLRGFLEHDPLEGMAAFDASPVSQRRAASPEEIASLLACCDAKRRRCYEVALCTGLRANELRSLRVRNLDVSRGGLVLEAEWTKNRKRGFQPAPAWLLEELAKDAVGRGDDERLLYVPYIPSRDLEKDLKRAGLSKWGPGGKLDFHSLRVTFLTLVDGAGAGVKDAQELGRHSTPQMTFERYVKPKQARLSGITEAVGSVVRPASTISAQLPRSPSKNARLDRGLAGAEGGTRTPTGYPTGS